MTQTRGAGRNVVLLGATRGMGRALARRLKERGDRLFLLGRSASELSRTAQDLAIRSGNGEVAGHALCDLSDTSTFDQALRAARDALFGRIDLVVLTAGIFAPQDELEADPRLAERVLTLDFTNSVLFCEAARRHLLAGGGGTLCVFTSVAGDRGRKGIVLYGASKAGLSHYLEGLDHKFRQQGLVVIDVKPGFVRTSMTEGLKAPPFAGTPEAVAEDVLRAIDRGQPVLYTPAMWGPVMAVIRRLPRQVMRRASF